MKIQTFSLMVLLTGASVISAQAQSSFVVTLVQEGNDVVATGNGNIDLTGLTYDGGSNDFASAYIYMPQLPIST